MKRLFATRMNRTEDVSCGTRPLASFLLIAVLIWLSSFVFPAEAALQETVLARKAVAEVNQAYITDAALMAEVRAYLRKIGHKELSAVRMTAVKKNALKKLIEEELLYQEALRLRHEGASPDFRISEAEIEAGVLGIRNRFPSAKAYKSSLLKEGLTQKSVREGIERSLLIRKTWEVFSSMNDKERAGQLKVLTKSAAIQIYAHPVAIREEKHSVAAQQ